MQHSIFLLLIITVLSGCTFANVLSSPEQQARDVENYSEWRKQRDARLTKLYSGMTEEALKEELGEPKRISYNYKLWHNDEYIICDQLWYYEYHTGIKYVSGDSWMDKYFFKDGVVIRVE